VKDGTTTSAIVNIHTSIGTPRTNSIYRVAEFRMITTAMSCLRDPMSATPQKRHGCARYLIL
jgi:hypothetical protein